MSALTKEIQDSISPDKAVEMLKEDVIKRF